LLKRILEKFKNCKQQQHKQIAGGFGKNIKMFNILIIAC